VVVPRPRSSDASLTWVFAVICICTGIVAEDWLVGAGMMVLGIGWKYLPRPGGLPVLPLAFTFQWLQIMSALLYRAFAGRTISELDICDYRPMVLIGLGSLLSLMIGLNCGFKVFRSNRQQKQPGYNLRLPLVGLLGAYAVLTLLSGIILRSAWDVPGLTQQIIAVGFARLIVVYILFRRFMLPRPRYLWMAALVTLELLVGFTGFFASFREPLIMMLMVCLERFNPRQLRHWVAVAVVCTIILSFGFLWLSVRHEYRKGFTDQSFADSSASRLVRMQSLSSGVLHSSDDALLGRLDFVVSRLWAVYYPALAVARVPAVLPHEEGKILWQAIQHIFTPRLLFPEKERLQSDSDMVRKYSGVWVAGEEAETSIAFGYAVESYVDFGVPLMFIPIFAFGVLEGIACKWLLRVIVIREISVSLAAVIFWLSLYLFERSWIKTIGFSATLIIFLGGSAFLLDRWLLRRELQRIGRRVIRKRSSAYPERGPSGVGFRSPNKLALRADLNPRVDLASE
jgi:hypothetical protein